LTNLTVLNLADNKIALLPEWITNLKNLEVLNISCTNILVNKDELKNKLPKLREIIDWG